MSISQALNKIIAQLPGAIEKSLDEIAKVAQDAARSTTLFKIGALKDNIKILKNGSMARTVLADKDYAYYLEEGNNQKGEYIYPVRAKALHFFVNGNEVFTKRSRTHGPLPFMRDAAEKAEKEASKIFEKHLKSLW